MTEHTSPVRHICKRLGPLWGILCLSFLALACRLGDLAVMPPTTAVPTPTETGQIEPDLDRPIAAALPGSSRENPIPVGKMAVTGRFEITLLQSLRGDAAWQEIHLANANNAPAPEGWEYLLVKVRVINTDSDPQKRYLGLHVTGDGRIVHFSFNSGVVSPKPPLATSLSGLEVSEGWEAYLIHLHEGNLMLVANDHTIYDPPSVYLAVNEGASITVDRETMLRINPTDLGVKRDDPTPFGQTATGEDWQVMVMDVVWGDAAWEMILDTNQFNNPPPEGMVYILAKVRVRYIGLAEDQQSITTQAITLLDGSGEEIKSPTVVSPEPKLFFHLYAGGEVEGWIVLQAPAEAKNLTLYFQPTYGAPTVNGRYLSLGQGR
ncbi:MAG: hypothetical protein IPM39_18000 [Chloroflexi bacterium]|nr:hypothetical protein [Chloroflexota bacterium]